jgi:outer membrane protein OmpA-like peptidoglycan-associated protein
MLVRNITLAIFFVVPAAIASSNCDKATELVIQAYDYGNQEYRLKQAISLCPTHADAFNNLASFYEDEGSYKKAIDHYLKAINARPNFSNAWFGLGETYYKQGQLPLSLEAHSYACKEDADSRRRIKSLLKGNRYQASEKGQILSAESLLVLYDVSRMKNIHRRIKNCGLTFRTIGRVKPSATFRNLEFDLGKATLKESAIPQLEQIVAALITRVSGGSYRGLTRIIERVEVHGHTDNRGFKGVTDRRENARRNKALSEKRAASIAKALIERGIPEESITTYGHGQNKPLSGQPGYSAKNRRVEINLK